MNSRVNDSLKTRPRLSLCMIVKNEELFLGAALKEAARFCDELVVVDTGSTDATVAIATQAGAKVFPFAWTGDFAAARNDSIARATGDWIVVLDADERVTAADWVAIRKAISDAPAAVDSYSLCQINYSRDASLYGFTRNDLNVLGFAHYPGYGTSWLARLFRNDPALRFSGVVHEHLCRDGKLAGETKLDVRLHHHGQALDPDKMREKRLAYRKLGEAKLKLAPDDFKTLNELGIACWETGDLAEATPYLTRAFSLHPRDLKNALALGSVLQLSGSLSEAEAVFRKAAAFHPDAPFVQGALGCCLLKLSRFDEAIVALKSEVALNPDFPAARLWLHDAYAARRFADPDTRPSLSVCYIVKDEADCLGESLASVRSHCDEVIVVDTGSSDGTREIAAAAGAKVYDVAWRDDFAFARNESLKRATSEWILVLDADETVGTAEWMAICELLRRPVSDEYFLVQTTYSDQATVLNWKPNDLSCPESLGQRGYFESPLVRLFRNTPRISFHGAVHEHAAHDDPAVQPVMTPIRIHHYGKFRDAERMAGKGALYRRIGLKKIAAMPDEPHAYYEMAVQLMELGESDGVAEFFLKALKLDPNHCDALLGYANFLMIEERYADALDAFVKLISLKPADPQGYIFAASTLIRIGKTDLALRMIETAKELGAGDCVALLMNEGVVRMRLGDNTRAEELFRNATAINPDFAPALINLGEILSRQGKYEEAESVLRHAAARDPRSSEARQRLGEMLFQSGRRKESLAAFLSAYALDAANPELLSQIVIVAHWLNDLKTIEDFEAKLAALARTPRGEASCRHVLNFYGQRGDLQGVKRLAILSENGEELARFV